MTTTTTTTTAMTPPPPLVDIAVEDPEHRGFHGLEWEVHKFGGTSVASAECFLKAASIVEERLGVGSSGAESLSSSSTAASESSEEKSTRKGEEEIGRIIPVEDRRLGVVVSAMGGKPKVTDLLLTAVEAASQRDEKRVDELLDQILEKHVHCLRSLPLLSADPPGEAQRLISVITSDMSNIRDILKTVSLMKWQAKRISELVSGYGEVWSAQILAALLTARSNARAAAAANVEGENNLIESSGNGNGNNIHRHHLFAYLDARRVITIDEDAIQDGAVCWDQSSSKLIDVYAQEVSNISTPTSPLHFVITGYVASNTNGVATTLQRDGSDYSAAIMGRLLSSTSITIWTDVDGVLSADPRLVPEAYVLPEVSFSEAMELAFFGAKVIHPKTMQPAILSTPQIPIFIRNTFSPSLHGTRIFTSSTTHTDRDRCVCGFSSINDVALINVEGSGLMGVHGVARRLFGTLQSVGVNVVLISQASSEHSITFATAGTQAQTAKDAIEDEFHKELKQNHISNVDVQMPCSIIGAVGDGMSSTTGVAGRFFSALGDAKINVLAIAQGCSERNISAVVQASESTRALRAVHAAFRLSHTTVRVGVVGMNDIGISLLKLLKDQRGNLQAVFDIDVQVCAIVSDGDSNGVVRLKPKNGGTKAGISTVVDSITVAAYNNATLKSPSNAVSKADGNGSSVSFDKPYTTDADDIAKHSELVTDGGLSALASHLIDENCAHTIIFDCTADEAVGNFHAEWLRSGIHVITANNHALSGSAEQREAIRLAEETTSQRQRGEDGKWMSARYLREVTVGGGLPVISTLRQHLNSGDKIRRIDGIMSVSISYIMHRIAPPPHVDECSALDEDLTGGIYCHEMSMTPKGGGGGCSFGEAVREAIALGLMETDPMKDLNFEYTARCLMVLAKELGLDRDYDVQRIQEESEQLITQNKSHVYNDEVIAELNERMQRRVEDAAKRNCVPRQVSSIDVKARTIDIKIIDVPNNHVFAVTPPSCECVRFFTQRHQRYPLIVQGPSAGSDSTSSALLAELLNLMRGKAGTTTGHLSRTGSSVLLA